MVKQLFYDSGAAAHERQFAKVTTPQKALPSTMRARAPSTPLDGNAEPGDLLNDALSSPATETTASAKRNSPNGGSPLPSSFNEAKPQWLVDRLLKIAPVKFNEFSIKAFVPRGKKAYDKPELLRTLSFITGKDLNALIEHDSIEELDDDLLRASAERGERAQGLHLPPKWGNGDGLVIFDYKTMACTHRFTEETMTLGDTTVDVLI